MVHSLNKGKKFEREVAALLSNTTEKEWHRVPMSGAMSTSNTSQQSQFKGDVFTDDIGFKHIIIECKHHKDITLSELHSKKGRVKGWIDKLEKESAHWALFMKLTNKGIYFLYPVTPEFIGERLGIINRNTDEKIYIVHDNLLVSMQRIK